MTDGDRVISAVTCLGCGCACDDIEAVVRGDRLHEAKGACALGVAWFGDGRVPAAVLADGRVATMENALDRSAAILSKAGRRALVYLAPDLTCEAQGEAIALADQLHARLDSVSSDTVAAGILAGQRRGRAGATLGEVRNRADVVVFWGVDPAERYPRYAARYALDPAGLQVPGGRKGRTVIAVDVGTARGPTEADQRLVIDHNEEVAALSLMRAVVSGREVAPGGPGLTAAVEIARRLAQARYAVIVHDAEPGDPGADPGRAEALIALTQALNTPTRAALSSLRAGGNRSGADAVMTWQTGYPFAVDFSRAYPRYRPEESASVLLAGKRIEAVLLLGSASEIPARVAAEIGNVPVIIVGPRASEASIPTAVAIDTGKAGIHEAGTAFRMDDVPVSLRPSVAGPPAAAETLRALLSRLRSKAARPTR